jgi:general secretion pathway protein H
MSRAGAAEAGFTLIELLAVLTIVALLAAVAAPRLQSLSSPSIDRTSRRVALAVRDQRSLAMLTGRLVTFAPDAAASLLPAGTELVAADEDQVIQFYPSGTSSGGSIVLAAQDGRRAVTVDWLTGRVTVKVLP